MATLKSITRNWHGQNYTSKSELFELGKSGVLTMQKDIQEFGTWYSFLDGDKFIAKFYQDHTFGFCNQPYGIKIY